MTSFQHSLPMLPTPIGMTRIRLSPYDLGRTQFTAMLAMDSGFVSPNVSCLFPRRQTESDGEGSDLFANTQTSGRGFSLAASGFLPPTILQDFSGDVPKFLQSSTSIGFSTSNERGFLCGTKYSEFETRRFA